MTWPLVIFEQAQKIRIKKDTLLPHAYATIIGLLWVTGMRIGKVVQLKTDDVDTTNGIIQVQQTKFLNLILFLYQYQLLKHL